MNGFPWLSDWNHSPPVKDSRLKDKAWRKRVGFDNYYKAIWKTPTLGLYYSRRRKKA